MKPRRSGPRTLPSVSQLLQSAAVQQAIVRFGRGATLWTLRRCLAEWRERLRDESDLTAPPSPEALAEQAVAQLVDADRNALARVINATGILLHTGLGRAPLAQEAIAEIANQAAGYCNVELDLVSGERSVRSRTVEDLLCQLLGAEAALVVNNNAGATGLTLAALATGREVIVSHGELIEIGGGYRLPDVITTFGARLRPVGTTNKTRLEDYAAAISPETGALLVVHPSNYHIAGFTESTPLDKLAKLARQTHVPLVHDIGSGALVDFAPFGGAAEPIAARSLQAGADLVLFSGDKLLGGPQCGIVAGRADLVARVMQHPLNRALRVDKLTLAALRGTLKLYQHPAEATQKIPLLRLLSISREQVRQRCAQLAEQVRREHHQWTVTVQEDEAFLGGGSLPGCGMPSYAVAIEPVGVSVERFAKALRLGSPPVVARVQQAKLVVGLRSVFEEEDEPLGAALLAAAQTA
jgi:L-seryl-tRNA(Ser) seleniumtransferase